MKAFVYLVLDRGVEPNRWYIGYKVGDYFTLYASYKTSSKIVKPMMKERPQDFTMFLVACGTHSEMAQFEGELHASVDAERNPLYYNRHNSGGKLFNSLIGDLNPSKRASVRAKIRAALSGKPKPYMAEFNRRTKAGIPLAPEHLAKRVAAQQAWYDSPEGVQRRLEVSQQFSAIPRTAEWRRKISAALKGKKRTAEHRRNLSRALTGKKYGPRTAEHSLRIVASRIANGNHRHSAAAKLKIGAANRAHWERKRNARHG